MDSYLNQDAYPDWLAQNDDSKPQADGAEQAAPFFDLERLLVRPSRLILLSSPPLPSLPLRSKVARAQKKQKETELSPSLLCSVASWLAALSCVSHRQKVSMLTASRPCPTPSCRSATGPSLAQRLQSRHGLQQLVARELWFLARCSCCS